ncbi:hypothetical protein AB0M54_24545 [Actinoplanes sp. NPDC051470]|uniref:hypothetical protein n=1 Tax=Actinoplanes sp. NPDC051470 TaxID=3157224 RepID=UPI00344306B0
MTTTMDRPTGDIPVIAPMDLTRVIPAATIARVVYTGKHREDGGGIPAPVLTAWLRNERLTAAEQLRADTAAFIERLRAEAVTV